MISALDSSMSRGIHIINVENVKIKTAESRENHGTKSCWKVNMMKLGRSSGTWQHI